MYVIQKNSEIMHMFEKERMAVEKIKDTNKRNDINSMKTENEYLLQTACIVYAFETYNKDKATTCDKVGQKRKLPDSNTLGDFFTKTSKLSPEYIKLQNDYINLTTKIIGPLFGNIFEKDFYHGKKFSVQKKKKVDEWSKDSKKKEECLACIVCGMERYISDSDATLICISCGNVEKAEMYDMFDNTNPGIEGENAVPFSYQRISHFNGWLNQFQAKEKTHIEFAILEELSTEFVKAGKRLSDITVMAVRQYLKKLSKKYAKTGYRNSKYTKLYEHSAQIVHLLGGIPPPELTPLQEEKLRTMFRQIQEPFQIAKPRGRKNFLSYSYFFVKCTELLHWYELKKCFTLLKSREKLIAQDTIWKDICKILDWKFYPSV
jgi:hypothetical protein